MNIQTLLAIQCSLYFDKHQENQVHCLYLLSNFGGKSCISAKIEAVKHLLTVFTAKCGTAPTSNQIVESHGLF